MKKNNKLLLTKLNKNKKYIEKELKKILSDIITPKCFKKSNALFSIKWRKTNKTFYNF